MSKATKKKITEELEALNPTPIAEVLKKTACELPEPEPDNQSNELEDLRLQLEQARNERDYWQAQAPEAPIVDEEASLFYDGIKIPDYRLKSIYVPYNAQGVSKNIAYDPDSGESYHYTSVKVAHCPPGQAHHRMEEYRVRLDSRVVVPAFVAEALGNRADTQDYYPGVE